jgi:hypothetical protein
VQRSPTIGYLSKIQNNSGLSQGLYGRTARHSCYGVNSQTVRAEGRESMDPRRACSNPRNDTRLFYFAAALPTIGFVHGAADLNPLDEAAPESNVEITERRRGIPFLHRHAFWLAA